MPQTIESLAAKLQESFVTPEGEVYSPQELVETAAIKLWLALEKKDRAPLDEFLASLPDGGKILLKPLVGDLTLMAIIGNALREHELVVVEKVDQLKVYDRDKVPAEKPVEPSQVKPVAEESKSPEIKLKNHKATAKAYGLSAGQVKNSKKPRPLAG